MCGLEKGTTFRIVEGLAFKQNTDEFPEPVSHAAKSARMGVTFGAGMGVDLLSLGILLDMHVGGMMERIAKAAVAGAALRDEFGLAALLGDGSGSG